MKIDIFSGEEVIAVYTDCVIKERTFSFIHFTGKNEFGEVREISTNANFIVHHEPSKKE